VLIARDFLGDEYFERLIGMRDGWIVRGTVVTEPREVTIEFAEVDFDHGPIDG
jgi:hypothetical protein